jgi:hypothetical protein
VSRITPEMVMFATLVISGVALGISIAVLVIG